MRVLALASYDSFLNAARLIAPYFVERGCSVDYALVHARPGEQITHNQIQAFNLDREPQWVRLEQLCASGQIGEYDIILSCLEGVSTRRLFHCIAPLSTDRPLIISIFAGLVLRFPNDGYSVRQRSDLLWLNCRADMGAYAEMCNGFGLSADNARLFGNASLLRKIERSVTASTGPVVFFEQTVIPRYHQERLFLADQLVALARRHPTFRFAVKPRVRTDEATLHRAWHHIEPLLRQSALATGDWPDNLEIVFESASDLLSKASHCLTVCSTVAAEAIHAKIPTVIIGDFGAHDDYGMEYFYGSGLIRNFAEINFPHVLEPNREWLERYLADTPTLAHDCVGEALLLAATPRQSLSERPAKTEMSPELRQHLLGSHSEDAIITRAYQTKPKRAGRWRKSLAAFKSLASGLIS